MLHSISPHARAENSATATQCLSTSTAVLGTVCKSQHQIPADRLKSQQELFFGIDSLAQRRMSACGQLSSGYCHWNPSGIRLAACWCCCECCDCSALVGPVASLHHPTCLGAHPVAMYIGSGKQHPDTRLPSVCTAAAGPAASSRHPTCLGACFALKADSAYVPWQGLS